MRGWRVALVGGLIAMGLAAAGGSSAAISGLSGAIVQISPPSSVQFGVLESNDHMFAFDERQNVTLAADLPIDISQPGAYGPKCNCTPFTPGTIPAGTTVSSLFVHADPVGIPSSPNILDATVTTDSDILGIEVCGNSRQVCTTQGLDVSDSVLGVSGTSYPTNVFGRGMNFDTQKDFLIWMIDNRTVQIQTATRDHADQVRIITKGTPPPPPCTANPPKVNVRWHYSANGTSGSWSGTKAAACGSTLTMGPQAMEGDLKVSPGDVIKAGYDFTLPGNNKPFTLTFMNVQVVYTVRCVSGAAPSQPTFTLTMPNQAYSVNDSKWYPSGNQSSALVYQGSIAAPDLCGGGKLRLDKGGTFSAFVIVS